MCFVFLKGAGLKRSSRSFSIHPAFLSLLCCCSLTRYHFHPTVPPQSHYRKGSQPVRFSDNESWELGFICSTTPEQSKNISRLHRKQDCLLTWLMSCRASLLVASGPSLPPCKTCHSYDLAGQCRRGGTAHMTAVLQWVGAAGSFRKDTDRVSPGLGTL